jgi:hypothetical protein
MDCRLGGPQDRFGRCEEDKHVMPGIELRPSSPQPVAIPTQLSRLLLVTGTEKSVGDSANADIPTKINRLY